MRAFCTVSAPLEVCASTAEQLSPGSRFLALRLLSHQQQQPKTLYFLVDAKSRVREVYTQTCLHFATQGMLDTELFGLAVLIDGEYMFADPESKLSKYGPKSWRSSHTHGLDANGRPLLELHFRVQFYIESPLMLKDETSRHNYYLQLRHNVLQRELPRADQSDQALVFLAGLALQADLGDAPAMEDVVGGVRGGLTEAEHLANATTTTLPKISKRLSSANERMLRLSTYVASTSANGNSSSVTTTSNKRDKERNLATSNADYFRIEDYLPLSLHTAWARSALRACHREHQGLDSAKAELLYIQQACSLHETINAHTFRMRLLKSEQGAGSSWFVVYAKGVKILGGGQSQTDASTSSSSAATSCAATFLWPNITKLSFERKKFEIRSGESRIILYSTSDEKNKLLLTLCKDTHQWSMKLAARLKEVSKRKEEEEAESQRLHASYACSRSLLMPYKSKNEQRISVISSTSSNTTSGIVSDRVHSEDELEIMINTPPAPLAAPSTESLALAHLLDRDRPSSVSRQTSSVGQMSIEEQQRTNDSSTTEASAIATTTMTTTTPSPTLATAAAGTTTDSPSSQHNIGSQCSSTCSTVVVTSPPPPSQAITNHNSSSTSSTNSAVAVTAIHSTSSSLELGFSHTPQNSALSETHIEEEDAASVSGVSGVYTLAHGAALTETSGVYTMHSSELTGQSSELAESERGSSSHYAPAATVNVAVVGKRTLQDQRQRSRPGGGGVMSSSEFRLRSDSNISTSSSFRGDGSDPTDNKHSLLSAEELTNLIVGRGTYPSRQTVSSSLHSDCDYVTMPQQDQSDDQEVAKGMPPAPPPPYSARHETTGLCGPPISTPHPPPPPPPHKQQEVQVIPNAEPKVPSPAALPALRRRRDPPPYANSMKPRPTSLISVTSNSTTPIGAAGSMSSLKSTEEITARFITTRPQISILKAHTSLLPDGAKPSYAAPNPPSHCSSSAASCSGSICSHHQFTPLSQQSLHSNSNYAGGSQASLHHRHSGSAAIGIPIVPYGLHKSTASLHHHHPHHQTPHQHQQACVLLPVIKPRQFLAPPPPPPSLPRQPPPPPPPAHSHPHHPHHHLAGLYRKQLELYQQQLYSDVDYVIYPIQDPAVSQQEYLDAKQGSLLAAMAAAAPPPPTRHPYLAMQMSPAIYRSTPYLPLALSTHSRYASTQNLSDTYVQLPGTATYSPLYSPSMASLCSSYEPPPPPAPTHPTTQMHPHTHSAIGVNAASASLHFSRSRSDDNILNSLDSMPINKQGKRLPPPPPPPYVNRRLKKPPMPMPSEKPPPIPLKPLTSSSMLVPRKPPTLNPHHANSPITKTSSGAQWAGERPKTNNFVLGLNGGGSSGGGSNGSGRNCNSILAQLQASMAAQSEAQALDIALLREKSKHLDLPLISALCNDPSLLKQTKLKVTTTGNGSPGTGLGEATNNSSTMTTATSTTTTTMTTTPTTRSSSPPLPRKNPSISSHHRHPQDKLPPLPVQQLAEANNYVMDPAAVLMNNKQQHHKSYNSQT
ncbi:protein expanded isoform X1 [Drosophila tropicalis]|uniref:protein expanded isoform X1 n=1 Tax=Drosophila tropicalis TaxID=46794 RepID=UPI0035AC2369